MTDGGRMIEYTNRMLKERIDFGYGLARKRRKSLNDLYRVGEFRPGYETVADEGVRLNVDPRTLP
jgi:hypothetical protein